MKFLHAIIWPIIFLPVALSAADVYRWQDAKGKWHYTDKPRESQNAELMKFKPLNGMTSIEFPKDLFYKPDQKIRKARAPHLRSGSVLMFSTPTCGYCGKAKDYFRRNKIAFSEKDVSRPGAAQKQFASLGGRGVPLILVGTKAGTKKVFGFNEAKLASLLGL